ncbi:MAG: hypothetical protein WAM92_12530 [Mycobacterium sp.]
MTVPITLAILIAPFGVAVALSWMAHRSTGLRINVDGADAARMAHELDAIRTRFERQPAWPRSGALGERR